MPAVVTWLCDVPDLESREVYDIYDGKPRLFFHIYEVERVTATSVPLPHPTTYIAHSGNPKS